MTDTKQPTALEQLHEAIDLVVCETIADRSEADYKRGCNDGLEKAAQEADLSDTDIRNAKANSVRPEHTQGYIAGRRDAAMRCRALKESTDD